MSDEEPQMPPQGSWMAFPKELAENLRKQADMAEMSAEVFRHEVQDLFGELEQPHLTTLRHLLHHFATLPSKDSRNLASYLEGISAARLSERFGICAGCGRDHDAQLTETSASTDEAITPNEVPMTHSEAMRDDIGDATARQDREKPSGELSERDLLDMKQYGLDDLRDEDTHALLGFICLNCEARYISIADRMKRPPGPAGCSGCQQKAKWG